MADRAHLDLLLKGAATWNTRRPEQPYLRRADLRGADLAGADLRGTDLAGADLRGTDLAGADLRDAYLREANLRGTDLREANLRGTDLREAGLRITNLRGTDLRTTDLTDADLTEADLTEADLRQAHLSGSNLTRAILNRADMSRADLTGATLIGTSTDGADLTKALVGETIIGAVDLRSTVGLNKVRHHRPSTIGIDTLYRSEADIPDAFLRGCGVPKLFIDYSLDAARPFALEFHSAFISYSSQDAPFAERLYNDLFDGEHIPCWLDQHQLAPGDDLDQSIFGAIRTTDKILLVCSEASLTSWWVDREVSRGMNKEQERHGTTGRRTPLIIPLDLDGYIFSPECQWEYADDLTRRVVAKFAGWDTNEAAYGKALAGVVNALRASGPLKPILPPAML